MNVQEIITKWEALAAERTSFERRWDDASEFILPRRGRYHGAVYSGVPRGQQGRRVGDQNIDGRAGWACNVFASGLEALLTSQLTPWFKLTLTDRDLAARPEIAGWLETVSAKVLATFADPKSGFYNAARQIYLDLGALGTACQFAPERPSSGAGIVFQARHMSECFFDENSDGQVDQMYRHVRWLASQAVEFFTRTGAVQNLPEEIRKAAEDPRNRNRYRFIHAVAPRQTAAGSARFARNMPWSSHWIALDQKTLVREGGYVDFPYQVPRWEVMSGESYGRGPGDELMKNIKLVNAQKKTTLESAVLRVRPPVEVRDEGVLGTIKMQPGGINYTKNTMGRSDHDTIRKIDLAGDPGIGVDMMSLEHEAIERAFLTDIMTLPFLDRMTATEIAERRHLRLLQIAPMMSRPMREYVAPSVQRTFAVKYRRGDFGEAPRELLDGRDGGELEIEFTNPVAIAQRVAEAMEPTGRVLDVADRLTPYDPGVGFNLDADEILRNAHRAHGAPVNMLRSPEEVEALRQGQRAAVEEDRTMEDLSTAASASKDLAQAANLARPDAA